MGNENGNLLPNLLHFGRLLRALGLKISAGQLSDLARALTLIDITNRQDFYYASRGLLVTNPNDFERFDQAFDLFWSGVSKWLLSLGLTRHLRQPEAGLQNRDIASCPGRRLGVRQARAHLLQSVAGRFQIAG